MYVDYGAHYVNLVSQSVADSCPDVRDAMHTINELGALFSMSLTARSAFKKLVDSATAGQVKQIRPLCPT